MFFALAALFAACGPPPPTELPPMPDLGELQSAALLGPGDVIEVRVYQEKELSGLYRLGTDGRFDFPLVGEIEGAGQSPGALADLLVERLRDGYLRDPQVSVFVKEQNSKKVFVLGEVHKPGTFTYQEQMSVVQAVTLAGGLKTLAARDRLVLTRVVEGVERKYVVPFDAISNGQAPNVLLQPGDILFVPESWL